MSSSKLFPLFTFASHHVAARLGSKALQTLQPDERAQLLRNVAESLKHNQKELFIANRVDLEKAKDGSEWLK